MIREENKRAKEDVDVLENKLQQSKELIRKKDIEKEECEKIFSDNNTNK